METPENKELQAAFTCNEIAFGVISAFLVFSMKCLQAQFSFISPLLFSNHIHL